MGACGIIAGGGITGAAAGAGAGSGFFLAMKVAPANSEGGNQPVASTSRAFVWFGFFRFIKFVLDDRLQCRKKLPFQPFVDRTMSWGTIGSKCRSPGKKFKLAAVQDIPRSIADQGRQFDNILNIGLNS